MLYLALCDITSVKPAMLLPSLRQWYPPEAVLECARVGWEDWESSVIRPIWAAWEQDEREPSWGCEGQQMVACWGGGSQAEPFRF